MIAWLNFRRWLSDHFDKICFRRNKNAWSFCCLAVEDLIIVDPYSLVSCTFFLISYLTRTTEQMIDGGRHPFI